MTDQPTGVKKNGLHQQTTNHLNLTRTLADYVETELEQRARHVHWSAAERAARKA